MDLQDAGASLTGVALHFQSLPQTLNFLERGVQDTGYLIPQRTPLPLQKSFLLGMGGGKGAGGQNAGHGLVGDALRCQHLGEGSSFPATHRPALCVAQWSATPSRHTLWTPVLPPPVGVAQHLGTDPEPLTRKNP